MTKKEFLEEDFGDFMGNMGQGAIDNILMVAGFVPVIGEIADIVMIIRFYNRGDKVLAALMLIALVPGIGDVIAKPFIWGLKKLGGPGRAALRNSDDMARLLENNPTLKRQYENLIKHADDPAIRQTLDQLAKVNKGWADSLRGALGSAKSAVGATKTVSAASKISTNTLKGVYQNRALQQYIAKTGKSPGNMLSQWWNVTRAGRTMRKNEFRKFVMGNNMLNRFGLPNVESFFGRMENDADFREELMNDPQFANYINQNTSESDIEMMNQSGGGADASALGAMSLPVLKMLARMYA